MNWREQLNLETHPEGGHYRRIFTAAESVATARGQRRTASAIHYLLDQGSPRGRIHRVQATILHFLQAGGPVEYACVSADGTVQLTTLGFAADQRLFLEVPAGVWKCSRLAEGTDHALVSEVVIPGFDWADHEYGTPEALGPALWQILRSQGWA